MSCERHSSFGCLARKMLKIVLVLLLLLATPSISQERTVFGKLKSGFQLAGKLLGIDQAKGVAQLVTEAFGKTHKKGDASEAPSNIFSGFLRILGFDSKKVGAIAVNAIIFIAQLISSTLSRPLPTQLSEARADIHKGSPMEWIMNNTEVTDMIGHVTDRELPEHVITYIKSRSMDEETDCVQLLICKISPFVWGMQRALTEKGNGTVKGPKALYHYLPTLEDVADFGDRCAKKHPYCFVDI